LNSTLDASTDASNSIGIKVASNKRTYKYASESGIMNAFGMNNRNYELEDTSNQVQIESIRTNTGGPYQTLYKVANCHYTAQTLGKRNMNFLVKAINQRDLTKSTHVEDWGWKAPVSLLEIWAWQRIVSYSAFPANMMTTRCKEHVRVTFPDQGVSCMHLYYPEVTIDTIPTSTSIIKRIPANVAATIAAAEAGHEQVKKTAFEIDVEIRDRVYACEKATPVLLICPALTSNQNQYVTLIQKMVQTKKWSVVVANRRGLCEPLATPVFHLMGDDEDLHSMVLHIQDIPRLKGRPLYAIGISVGGNWLLRYLGKYGRNKNHIISAATISSPLNLDDLHVKSPVIGDSLLANVKQSYLQPNHKLFNSSTPNIVKLFQELLASTSLVSFAYIHTQLFYLYTNSEAIYNENNIWNCYASFDAARYAKYIEIPVLVIIADDDPVIRTSPSNQIIIRNNPHITRVLTNGGSHCMFRDDIFKSNSTMTWAEGVVLGFFVAVEDSEATRYRESLVTNNKI
jgi:predicted alpha/beta-fold hydrolase